VIRVHQQVCARKITSFYVQRLWFVHPWLTYTHTHGQTPLVNAFSTWLLSCCTDVCIVSVHTHTACKKNLNTALWRTITHTITAYWVSGNTSYVCKLTIHTFCTTRQQPRKKWAYRQLLTNYTTRSASWDKNIFTSVFRFCLTETEQHLQPKHNTYITASSHHLLHISNLPPYSKTVTGMSTRR